MHNSVKIHIIFGKPGNPFWERMLEGFETHAVKFGFEVQGFFPDGGRDDAQLRLLIEAVESDADLIIVNPNTVDNLMPGLQYATKKNKLIIDLGGKVDEEEAKLRGIRYYPVRTVNFGEQGAIAARFFQEELPAGAEVALMLGASKSKQSIERASGFEEEIKRKRILELVDRIHARFDATLAVKTTNLLLHRYPNLMGIFCVNDVMALGTALQVKEAGKGQGIKVVGVDGIDEALTAVKEGWLSATVAFSPVEVSKGILDCASLLLRGEKVPSDINVLSRLVTRRDIEVNGYQSIQDPV